MFYLDDSSMAKWYIPHYAVQGSHVNNFGCFLTRKRTDEADFCGFQSLSVKICIIRVICVKKQPIYVKNRLGTNQNAIYIYNKN